MSGTAGSYKPAWWLRNPHLQTLWPSRFRTRPRLPLSRKRLELPDKDFLDLSWMPDNGGDICLVLHGLEGSMASHYSGPLLMAATRANMQGVFMHFRGCSGEHNRLPRRYHSGDTSDLICVLDTIKQRYPDRDIHAIGVSLGGNILLKYLGEHSSNPALQSAAAISVPYDLANGARTLRHGAAKIYQRHLLNSLRSSFYQKTRMMKMPIPIPDKDEIDTIYDFDNLVTAPLHGFRDADDYYEKSSCRQFIPSVRTPTLLLHAIDDPFMTPEAIPEKKELPHCVRLELSKHGGHVGFIEGNLPLKAGYWMDRRIESWLKGY